MSLLCACPALHLIVLDASFALFFMFFPSFVAVLQSLLLMQWNSPIWKLIVSWTFCFRIWDFFNVGISLEAKRTVLGDLLYVPC